MSTHNTTHTYRGIGFSGLLAIVFITLKLTNVIQWSWLWVLSPIWISFLVYITIIAIILIAVLMEK
jgi:hypothetical protein